MFENYVYGSVVLDTTTLSQLNTLIVSQDIIYFNYAVDVSASPSVIAFPIAGAAPQYLFNPAVASWRIHFLSSPENVLTYHPTYVAGSDSLNRPGFVWVFHNILTD